MVELKIDGHIYKVSDISWEYDWNDVFRRWREKLAGSGSPKSLEIHFKSRFYFTPAPPSKRKCDKIWGECRKSKSQIDVKNIDISKLSISVLKNLNYVMMTNEGLLSSILTH